MDPLVTIGIPTFNRGDERLRRVVDAALAQSWTNLEVLVGDNASSDNTERLMHSIRDPRVRYIRHSTNIGANANFNFLLNEAKGQWFLLFHDDDLIDTDFIECCVRTAGDRDDLGFVISGVRSIDIEGKTIKESPVRVDGNTQDDFYFGWFESRIALFLCNTLCHTDKLRKSGGYHSLHYLLEDNYALVNLLKNWCFAVHNEVKASYRYTYDQQTYNVPVLQWCQDFRHLLSMIVTQCSPESKTSLQVKGRRFFGELCNKRANAISNPIKRNWARLVVARYFGVRTLRQPWPRPRQ